MQLLWCEGIFELWESVRRCENYTLQIGRSTSISGAIAKFLPFVRKAWASTQTHLALFWKWSYDWLWTPELWWHFCVNSAGSNMVSIRGSNPGQTPGFGAAPGTFNISKNRQLLLPCVGSFAVGQTKTLSTGMFWGSTTYNLRGW